eukprot:1643278-Prymnesium_polylepis.1
MPSPCRVAAATFRAPRTSPEAQRTERSSDTRATLALRVTSRTFRSALSAFSRSRPTSGRIRPPTS